MTTINEAIKNKNMSIENTRVNSNPNMLDMPLGSLHWKCKLKRNKKQMIIYFSQGPAINKDPELIDVLDCLLSDASFVEAGYTVRDFSEDLGYTLKQGTRVYRAIKKQTEKLENFLEDDFDYFINEVTSL